jgi:hypothetical protein
MSAPAQEIQHDPGGPQANTGNTKPKSSRTRVHNFGAGDLFSSSGMEAKPFALGRPLSPWPRAMNCPSRKNKKSSKPPVAFRRLLVRRVS